MAHVPSYQNSLSITEDDSTKLTLADYLQGDDREYFRLKPVPRINLLHKMNGFPFDYTSSVHKDSSDSLDSNSLSKPQIASNDVSDNGLMNNEDSVEYLFRRRTFLRTLLIDRYAELVRLMQEEMDLTGHPPDLYHNYLHEYQAFLATIPSGESSKISDQTNNCSLTAKTENGNRDTKVVNRGEETASHITRTDLPMADKPLGTRLQPTGFTISHAAIRRAVISHSTSYNSLLNAESVSSPTDVHLNANSIETTAHRESPKPSPHSSGPVQTDKSRGTLYTPSKLIQHIRRRTNRYSATPVHKFSQPSSESTSLTDLRPTRSAAHSFSDCGGYNNLEDRSSNASPSPAIPAPGHNFEIFTEKDREHAICLIDMELAALQNIIEANQRCSNESWRKKVARKAYKLAASQNNLAIHRLREQRQQILAAKLKSIDSFPMGESLEDTEPSGAKCDENNSLYSESSASVGEKNTCFLLPDTINQRENSCIASSPGVYDGLHCLAPNAQAKSDDDQLACSPSSPRMTAVSPMGTHEKVPTGTKDEREPHSPTQHFHENLDGAAFPSLVYKHNRLDPMRNSHQSAEFLHVLQLDDIGVQDQLTLSLSPSRKKQSERSTDRKSTASFSRSLQPSPVGDHIYITDPPNVRSHKLFNEGQEQLSLGAQSNTSRFDSSETSGKLYCHFKRYDVRPAADLGTDEPQSVHDLDEGNFSCQSEFSLSENTPKSLPLVSGTVSTFRRPTTGLNSDLPTGTSVDCTPKSPRSSLRYASHSLKRRENHTQLQSDSAKTNQLTFH